MKEYEISYLLRSEQGNDLMRKLFVHHGGEVSHMEELRKIALAYPIKKEEFGFFGFSRVSLEQSAIVEIEKEAKLEGDILRMLVISEPIVAVHGDQRIPSSYQRHAEDTATQPQKEEKPVTNEELEKKLEEILG